ncbi:unnamed protein product [Lactuca saligna]|uniref:Arabidopsis retrotransposon Orf1 C-terminal domain-containing protein n=1 Tax=Lactuca saligna TaxID=75948 RepID=A0AA35ZL20_LACSI|nr:unnamed protein product [Lactuca saligna]
MLEYLSACLLTRTACGPSSVRPTLPSSPLLLLPNLHWRTFISTTKAHFPVKPPAGNFSRPPPFFSKFRALRTPLKQRSDLLLYLGAPSPSHRHFPADFRPTPATSRDSATTIVLLLGKATNPTKNISQSSPKHFAGTSSHCRIRRVFTVNCFSWDIKQKLKAWGGELQDLQIPNFRMQTLNFQQKRSMSTSRKRSAASRGKAPTRDQSDAPDVPRFREAKTAKNYTKSLPRKVASTKFVCKPALISLGVLEGVTQLFRNIGWENLLNLLAYTYGLPTREFLADSLPSSNTSTIHDVVPAEFNHETFWMEITRGIFSCVGRGKATSIIHPCLRIAYRILVCMVFARKEAGQVTKNELLFLWCMTRHERPPIPDFASFFFHKCTHMRSKTSGDICIGGFVTLLARGLDIELPDEFQSVDSKNLLDDHALINMHHIRRRNRNSFTWFCPQGVGYLVLPDPRVTNFTFHDRTQWRLARTITQSINEDVMQDQDDDEIPMDDTPTHDLQHAQPQAPPGYYPLPPNFVERFESLCVSNQIMSQQMHHMWGWHQSQNHFENVPLPPPYPYHHPPILIPLHLTLTPTPNTRILLPIPRFRYFRLTTSIEDNAYF